MDCVAANYPSIHAARLALEEGLVEAVAYGLVLALFFHISSDVWSQRPRPTRIPWFLFGHAVAVFGVTTALVSLDLKIVEIYFITCADSTLPTLKAYGITVSVCEFLQILLQDGLLLYRFMVLCKNPWYIHVIPCLCLAATVVTGSLASASLTNIITGEHIVDISQKYASKSGVVFLSFTTMFNVLLSTSITGRLLWFRRRYRRVFGKDGDTHVYSSAITLIVESALICTIPAILEFAFMISPSGPNWGFVSGLRKMCVAIAPLLITQRVLKGRVLSSTTIKELAEKETLVGRSSFDEGIPGRGGNKLGTLVFAQRSHVGEHEVELDNISSVDQSKRKRDAYAGSDFGVEPF